MSSVSVSHDRSGSSSKLDEQNDRTQEHLADADTKIHSAQIVLIDLYKTPCKGCQKTPYSKSLPLEEKSRKSSDGARKEVDSSVEPDVSTVSEKSEESATVEGTLKDKPKRKRVSLRREKLESSLKNKIANNKLCVNFSASKKDKKPDLSDENTTNSENSEGAGLYGDVDWEGNLENDAQLDEFAPRRRRRERSPPVSVASAAFPAKMYWEDRDQSSSSHGSHTHNRFTAKEKVRVHNYNTSSWEEGEVEEIDELEQEVLIVSNGRKEWVSVNSQRISKMPKEKSCSFRGSGAGVDSLCVGSIIEHHTRDPMCRDEKPDPLVKTKVEPAKLEKSLKEKEVKVGADETQKSKIKTNDSIFFKSKNLERMKRKRSVPKRKEVVASSSKAAPVVTTKFKENEKVLAKWSNYRMQKFPAVIRKVCGKGEYDVLFYDGFVKTISEDNIYKATEEECVKYQGSNPSKADSFVEMDDDSKEARRQRKKKTFDDFFSAKDLERPRRKFPEEPGVRRFIKQKRSVGVVKRFQSKIGFPKRRRKFKRPVLPEAEAGSVADNDVEAGLADSIEAVQPEASATSEEQPEVIPPSTEDVPQPSQKVANMEDEAVPLETEAPLIAPATDEIPAKTEQSVEPIGSEEVIPATKEIPEPVTRSPHPVLPPAPPKADYGDRFVCNIPEGAAPVVIKTKDGNIHRSVIISDSNLLLGWVKHAVHIRGKQQVFLISPEGYKINSKQELQDFCHRILKTPAPPVLDFVVDNRVIPLLREQQKDMEITPVRYPTWKIKKTKGGKPGRAGRFTSHKFKNPIRDSVRSGPSQKVRRVRTLLPKYRYVPIPLEPPEPEMEKVWKCPKEGCEKIFRKESLLQMHIKHYHAEFRELVGSAPNVVDLATARSESNYAESLKPQFLPLKKPASKTSPHIGIGERNDSEYSSSPAQGSMSPHVGTSFGEDIPMHTPIRPFPPNKRFHMPCEERRTTIKTLLPTRHPTVIESHNSGILDSDDYDSEDEFVKHQKQPLKKMRYDHTVPREIRLTDHGYPMSPSFKYTKKKQPALEKLQITTDSNDSYTEEEKGSPIEVTEDGVVIERLRSEEIINCTCGFREEDGLMIQCDICMCWQHGICSGIESDVDVPERYVCYICRHPTRVRSSAKFNYAVHYFTQGKLPSLSFRTRDEKVIKERENLLKKCFDLTSNLHQMGNVGQSLAVKLKIAEERNHPKLYLWAKNWGNSEKKEHYRDAITAVVPEPEAPIDSEECRERLVKDVENDLQSLDERLNLISNQISCLEAQASGSGQSEANLSTTTIKQTVQMLMKDLKDLERLASISQP